MDMTVLQEIRVGIKVVKDVLDVVYATELYNKCIDMPLQRTSLDTWKDYLTDSKKAPAILLNDLDTNDQVKILEVFEEQFGAFNKAYLTVQRWEKGCYIPWHNDQKYDFSATIYLNPEWEADDGGQFVYTEDDDFYGVNHSYTPQFNSAVMLEDGHFHCVTPIGSLDKTRVTIQFFAYNG